MEEKSNQEPQPKKKFFKPHHIKVAALLALMIPIGALFTNGTWANGAITVTADAHGALPMSMFMGGNESSGSFDHVTLTEGGGGGSINEILFDPACQDGAGLAQLPKASDADIARDANYINSETHGNAFIDKRAPYDTLLGQPCVTDACVTDGLRKDFQVSPGGVSVSTNFGSVNFSISARYGFSGNQLFSGNISVPRSNIYNAQSRSVAPVCGSGCNGFRLNRGSTLVMVRTDSSGNKTASAVVNASTTSEIGGGCLVSAANR